VTTFAAIAAGFPRLKIQTWKARLGEASWKFGRLRIGDVRGRMAVRFAL
jgi:hypothetical protein